MDGRVKHWDRARNGRAAVLVLEAYITIVSVAVRQSGRRLVDPVASVEPS